MKTVSVLSVDISIMQPMLNQTFGAEVFIIDRTISEINTKSYYLQCEDTVPQTLVDQAVTFVNNFHNENLRNKKIRWYEKIQLIASDKQNTWKSQTYTDQETQAATTWLNNMSSPVPACVLFVGLKENCSNQRAAEIILESNSNYQTLVNQLNTIMSNFQMQLIGCTNDEIWTIRQSTEEEINNLPDNL